MKTQDRSVGTLGRKCYSIGLCTYLNVTRVASETRLLHLVVVNKRDKVVSTINSYLQF